MGARIRNNLSTADLPKIDMACFILKPVFWNTAGYRKPSGCKAQTGFPAEHGFGHEEWNNSSRLRFDDGANGVQRVFHTERVTLDLVNQNVGQTFVFMTASHGGTSVLVGVAGNATCLIDDAHDEARQRLAQRLRLGNLWQDAWEIERVRNCYGGNAARFRETWESNLRWIPNWVCPEPYFLWFKEPVELKPEAITGKSKLLTMFSRYTPLDLTQAETIMGMVDQSQRDDRWDHLVDAMQIAPTEPATFADIDDSGSPTTKATLINARRGQGKFRQDVLALWEQRCAVTGLTQSAALRASHIKPFSKCSRRECLDPNNGLMLSANLDALFDAKLITFTDNGKMLISSTVNKASRDQLGLPGALRKTPTQELRHYLKFHREVLFQR